MYYLPERNLVFLAHPRTASVATKRTLASLGPIEMINGHHGIDINRIPSNATVLATIRNPWDIFVSWWFKRRAERSPFYGLPLEKFIPLLVENNKQFFRKKRIFYMVQYATNILRYEHLQADFDQAIVGVGYAPRDLVVANKSERRTKPYYEYYNDQARNWVAEYFAFEIKRYGYEYGN